MTIRSLWRDIIDQTQATQTQLQFYAESCYASNSSRAFEGGSLAMFINMTLHDTQGRVPIRRYRCLSIEKSTLWTFPIAQNVAGRWCE